MAYSSARKVISEAHSSQIDYSRMEMELIDYWDPYGEEFDYSMAHTCPDEYECYRSCRRRYRPPCNCSYVLEIELSDCEERLRQEKCLLKRELCLETQRLCRKEEEIGRLNRRIQVKKSQKEDMAQANYLDGEYPTSIFPEEVWSIIFDQLTEPKDVLSCSRAHPIFWRILHPRTPLFLFHKILPSLYEHLDGAEILQCRLVCKAWEEGVNALFENSPFLRPHNNAGDFGSGSGHPNPMWRKQLGRAFTSRGGILGYGPLNPEEGWFYVQPEGQILERMLEDRWFRTRNPVIGRDIIIDSGCGLIQQFLEAYGKHIWYLTICYLEDCFGGPDAGRYTWVTTDPEERKLEGGRLFRLMIQDGARLLPNLRKLRIVGFKDLHMEPEVLKSGTVPFFPSLESLQLDEAPCSRKVPPSYRKWRSRQTTLFIPPHPYISRMVTTYHGQLGRLHLKVEDWKLASKLDWPGLQELHVRGWCAQDNFQSLFQAHLPKLQKLGVTPAYATMERLLELINTISGRSPLNSLKLYGPVPSTMEKQCPYFYAPLTLKTLEVELIHRWEETEWMNPSCSCWSCDYSVTPVYDVVTTDFGFLLHFPFLQSLHVVLRKGSRKTIKPEENPLLAGVANKHDIWTSDIQVDVLSDVFRERDEREQYEYESTTWDEYGCSCCPCPVRFNRWISPWQQFVGESEPVQLNKLIFRGEMYKSDIWKLLPRLKTVIFLDKVYTRREEKEEYCLLYFGSLIIQFRQLKYVP